MTPEEHQAIVAKRSDVMHSVLRRMRALETLAGCLVALREAIREPALPEEIDTDEIDKHAVKLARFVEGHCETVNILSRLAVLRRDQAINEREEAAGLKPTIVLHDDGWLDEELTKFGEQRRRNE